MFKNKIKHILIGLSIVSIFSLNGCAKVINTEIKDIKATIIETEYKDSYSETTYMMSGNTMMPITTEYSEEYNVVLEFEGRKYYLDNKDFYEKCKDKNGKEVNSKLQIKHYDDGSDTKDIIEVK